MSPSADSGGDRVFVVHSNSFVGVEATGNYVCRAEYEDGVEEQPLSINVQGVHSIAKCALYSKVCTIWKGVHYMEWCALYSKVCTIWKGVQYMERCALYSKIDVHYIERCALYKHRYYTTGLEASHVRSFNVYIFHVPVHVVRARC